MALYATHKGLDNKTLLEYAIFKLNLANTTVIMQEIIREHLPAPFVPTATLKEDAKKYLLSAYHKNVNALTATNMPARNILRQIKDYLHGVGVLTDSERRTSFSFAVSQEGLKTKAEFTRVEKNNP